MLARIRAIRATMRDRHNDRVWALLTTPSREA